MIFPHLQTFSKTVCAFFVLAVLIFDGPAANCSPESEGQDAPPPTPAAAPWDRYHSYLNENINKPLIWFDNFFGDPRLAEEDLPTSFIRWRNAIRFTEGEGVTFPIRIRANIKLPKASKRLRLVVTGENEDDLQAPRTDPSVTPGLTAQQDNNTSNVGLRYTLYKTLREILHLGGGLRLSTPFEYYVRAYYRRFLHIGAKNIITFTETGFWHSDEKLGETTRIDFNRLLSQSLSNRISVFGTYSEVSEGVEWGVEESLFKKLTPKTAISFDLGMYGDTRPHTEINNYRISSRFRANIFRPWLFFELEPEVTFPLDEFGRWQTVGAFTFVLEIQFLTDL